MTVGAQAVFPDLGETDPRTTDPITGNSEEVAATLKGWEQAGVAHLIIQCSPYTRQAQDRLAEAVRIFRQ